MFSDSAINGPDCWKCTLRIEWHDCSWCPSITLRQGIELRQGASTIPLPAAAILPHPVQRKNLAKPMKKIRRAAAFTLVELLVVIAIIGILAGMLLTVLPAAVKTAKVKKAAMEMADLANAIQSYDQDYGRFPITPAEQAAAGTNDFTTGYVSVPQSGINWPNVGGSWAFDNNSNVVAILMDMTSYPNGNATANANHVKNPKQVKYLNAKMSGDSGTGSQPPAGVDNNGVFRDPWGSPYIITMNTSYNEQGTRDLVYSRLDVSQNGANSQSGFNGLFNPVDANGNGNHFLFHGKVMVWSAGPDKQVDPDSKANAGVNKDNILSWK
jgi:prepilin-type N-terminal cleavage/methylation domain-containing protein